MGAAFTGIGCSPGALGALLMLGQDFKVQPKCDLAKSRQDVKVVVVADAGLNFTPEVAHVDKILATKLADVLSQRYKENKDRITVVPSFKVEAYRQSKLDWRTLSAQEIGKHFDADYVINLDIAKISLYMEKSAASFYRGQAEIAVKVIDVKAPDGEGLKFSEDYVCQEYPRAAPVETTSISVGIFRAQFLNHVAGEISHYFAAYPSEKRFDMR
jgi:hypothetical protein